MKSKLLRLICAVMALLLAGCGAGKNTAKKESKDTTVAVECMTGYEYNDTEYTVTYEKDGVHLTPTVAADSSAYAYVYSWDGRLLLEQLVDSNGTELSKTVLSYDKNGNLTERAYTSNTSESATRWVYTYSDQGRLTEQAYYSRPGALSYTYSYTYDSQGFPVECLVTDADTGPRWKYVYTCDDTGRVVSGQRIFLSEQLGQTGLQSDLVYAYDDAGRLLALEWRPVFDNNKLRESKYYTYDEAGRMIRSQIIHQERSTVEDKTYTYDAQGRLTSVVDAKGATREFTYGQMNVSSKLAEDVQRWSSTGVIKAYTPAVTPIILG